MGDACDCERARSVSTLGKRAVAARWRPLVATALCAVAATALSGLPEAAASVAGVREGALAPDVTPAPQPPARCISQPQDVHTVEAGRSLTLAYDTYSDTATVSLRRESPPPAEEVRSGQGMHVEFTIRPPENTELTATSGPDCVARITSTVHVVPAVAIAARRLCAREYEFFGRVLPGRGQPIALYRVEQNGRYVLTARSSVRTDGTYLIRRRFTGAGRYGFVVAVAATDANLAGQSTVRPTVVY